MSTDSFATQMERALGSRYTLERELGGGGMSRVFLGRDARFGRPVVVKFLSPDQAAEVSAERFAREIRLAAGLQQANIVPLLDAGEAEGLPYLVMPYVEGRSLRARLAAGTLPVSECLGILRDVAHALSYAHARGIVHRDIKPDNVLLSAGTAVVTDFGIAKALTAARSDASRATLTNTGTSLGTPTYMAPEQAAGDPALDHRADLYSLGVLAYEALAGEPPFVGPPHVVMAAHVTQQPPPLSARRPDVPPAVERVVMRCLEKSPAARYQTADAMLADLDTVATPGSLPSWRASRPRGRVVAAGALLAGVLAAAGWVGTRRLREERWARATAIPEIQRLVELARYDSAFALATRAQDILPDDSVLASLWPRFSFKLVLHSTPPGATVWRAPADDTSHWTRLGVTPLDTVRAPTAADRLRVEKPGYRPFAGFLTWGVWGVGDVMLDRVDAPHPEMVHVTSGVYAPFVLGIAGSPALKLADYWLDRDEVSNRQYKAFVDAGGYAKREYWRDASFGGDERTWAAARSRFHDRTGRPGPATWIAGDFPLNDGDLPVGGVSWYEAAAYARFAGKSLPTVYHWARAAGPQISALVVPGSNLDGTGPRQASRAAGLSAFGTFDMAGNVREWCANAASADERYILGGGWTDPEYAFVYAYAQRADDRSPINGIRLALYRPDDANVGHAAAPLQRVLRDYARERPVDDALFASYRALYDFDRRPLNARVDSRDSTSEDWVMERVSFDAAYGGERAAALVYLPRHRAAPYQTVLFFPGSGAIRERTPPAERIALLRFLVRDGRAVVLPIFKSTYERGDSLVSDDADTTIFWRDHVVMWTQDLRRTVDYLATRADVDTARLAYFGYSWGSVIAPLSLVLEPRPKTAVLYAAGLDMARGRPEVDPLNFLPRVRVPVLMLNGKYDYFYPTGTSQEPFFRLLGTPPEHKRHLVYAGGHDVPRTELIAQTLAWLDRYLGPVR
jgi:dienelactone hydrolase